MSKESGLKEGTDTEFLSILIGSTISNNNTVKSCKSSGGLEKRKKKEVFMEYYNYLVF